MNHFATRSRKAWSNIRQPSSELGFPLCNLKWLVRLSPVETASDRGRIRRVGRTTCDLYRMGNATSARLDYVRPIDVEHAVVAGVDWVRAGTGGVSTFSAPASGKGRCWWLTALYDYGALLLVWNDVGNHWSWEPSIDMPLSDYRSLLDPANRHVR